MVNKLFRFSLILISALLGAFLSLTILLWFYEDELGDKIMLELQRNAPTEITIEDQEFSIWKSLPFVSLDLKKILIKDENSKILLGADVLGLRLSLLNAWNNELKIENILIENGQINLIADRKGNYNYDFLFENQDTTTESYFKKFNIDYAKLKNINIGMKHYRDQWELEHFIRSGQINILAQNSDLNLDGELAGMLKLFRSQKKDILKNVESDFVFECSSKENAWTFSSDLFSFGKDPFIISGTYHPEKKNELHLNLEQKKGNIAHLHQIFKSLYPENFKVIPTGAYTSSMRYKQSNGIADFELTGELKDARLKSSSQEEIFNDMSAQFALSKPANIEWKDLTVVLSDIKCSNQDFHLESDVKIIGLSQPRYQVGVSGTMSVPALAKMIQDEQLKAKKGVVTTKNFKFDISSSDSKWNLHRADGDLELEQLQFDYRKQRFDVPQSKWTLSNDLLYMNPVDLSINKKRFSIGLSLPDLKQNIRRNKLKIMANIEGEQLDYELLQKLLMEEESPKQPTADSDKKPLQIETEILGKVKAFNYQKNTFSDVQVDLHSDQDQLDFDIRSKAYEGSLHAKGKYYFDIEPKLTLNLETKEVLIKSLLQNFDNFDQEVVMDKNIEGKMNSKNVIRLFWDEKGQYLEDRLEVYSDILIKDGELKGLTMLYDFSSFIKLRDLMEIKFSNLHNYLEVSNETVYIPQMFIQSSAMNMTVAGTHGFDSKIRYGFKFNAGQILLNKLRKYDNRRKPLPAKKEGMFNMYFNLAGTVQDYEVKNSKNLVKTYFDESQVHKYIIYEELKRAYPDILNPEYEPKEWLDVEENSNDNRKPEYLEPIQPRDDQDEDFIEGF